MSLYVFFPLAASFANLFLGLFAFLKNKFSAINKTFAFWLFSIALWNFGLSMLYDSYTQESAFFWAKILVLGLVFIPPTFYHFVLEFTEDKHKRRKILSIVLYFIAGFLIILDRGTYFTAAVAKYYWGYYAVPGIGTHFLTLILLTMVPYSFYVLFMRLKQSQGLKRKQCNFVFWASAIGWGGGITNLFPLYGIIIYPIGNLSIIFFTAIIAYAILKHRLMDIEIIIKKGVIYSTLIGASTGTYVVITLIFSRMLKEITGNGELLIIILTAVFIVVGFRPLENFLEKATEKIFFKKKYDYRKAINELTQEICSVIDLKQLLNLIVTRIAKTMKINTVSILLREDSNNWAGIKCEYTVKGECLSEIKLSLDEAFNKWMTKSSQLILCDEIEKEEIKACLKKLGATICIPLLNRGEFIAILNIGDKLSEDSYTNEDLELLSTLAGEASIALQNAKLIEREKGMIRELEHAERLALLGRFTSRLVHEIRNPLVSIKAFFRVLGDQDESEEDKQELSLLASQELIRLEELLEKLLNFAKPSEPEFSYQNVFKILNETLLLVKPEMVSKKVNLYVEKEAAEAPQTLADGKQLKQVFLNLIYNALQAMPDGGELHIKMNYKASKQRLIIKFTDTGCGIEPQAIKKLFEPFYTTRPEGSGIGLAVSYNIIKSHKGEIRVTSQPGKGSTFEVLLPVISSAQDNSSVHK